jgi:hypothetical protein
MSNSLFRSRLGGVEAATVGNTTATSRESFEEEPATVRRKVMTTEVTTVGPPTLVTEEAASGCSAETGRYSWAIMLLMLFSILIAIVVIILLWVTDFTTNQYADTGLLAVQVVLNIIVVVLAYYMMPASATEI